MKKLHLLLVAICAAALILSGCGNSVQDFVFTNSNGLANNGGTPSSTTFDLEVGFEPTALARTPDIRAQIGSDVTQYRATLYSSDDVEVDQQTAERNQNVIFRGLSPGDYLIRFEGLDAAGNVVGYFDRIVTIINSRVTSLAPGLRLDSTPPAPSFTATESGTPFFIFTSVPSTAQGITGFSVTAQVFDGQGNPTTTATTDVGLTSSDLPFETAVVNQDTDSNGIVTFEGVRFQSTADGTTTLTVGASGVESAVSSVITVSPPGSFFLSLEFVCKTTSGVFQNNNGFEASISGDGRFVAFDSAATNLVDNDTNGSDNDIFVRDRELNTLKIVSVNNSGQQGNDESFEPAISANGRFVAFISSADNLVPNDTNNSDDIFVYDLQTNTIELVSKKTDGTLADDDSFSPAISDDGRIVVFLSPANNLDSGTPNNLTDVFAYDRVTGTLKMVNAPGTVGIEGAPSVSGNGRFVAYSSTASEGVSDTNGTTQDCFVYDLDAESVQLASTDSQGAQSGSGFTNAEPTLSNDGRFVLFQSRSNFGFTPDNNGADFDLYVKDRQTGVLERVSQNDAGDNGNGESRAGKISGDGRFVAFTSFATNLVNSDQNGVRDVFIYDRNSDKVERVSVSITGQESGTASSLEGLSADGRFVVFSNFDPDLIPDNDPGGFFTMINPFRR